MEIHTDDMPTGRMWRIYVCGWLAYLLLLGFALQLDNLRKGQVDWRSLMDLLFSVPAAPILALLWPLSGYLERRRLAPVPLFLTHTAGALVYGVVSYSILWTLFGEAKPLAWHIWPVMYSVMMYIFIAALFHTVRMSHAAQRQRAAVQQARNLLVASELGALRSKLNPHFLFNTLHSIIALTRKDAGAAEAALFQFSDMLRYVLDTEKSGNDRVTLEDELRFVRDYLELESLRLGARLQVDWELDEEAAHHALPALSLQPLVENSIKHAFNPHSRPGRLLIRSRVERQPGALVLTVGDDGPGADPDAVRRSTGLGIRTVDRRLQLEYGARAGLAIDTRPGAGFCVTMSIPLESA